MATEPLASVRDAFNPDLLARLVDAGVLFAATPLAEFVSGQLAVPRWAVEGIWAEGTSGIIAGRPKDGKSTLATELAISLWTGTSMFGLPQFPVLSRPANVVYVQQENSNARAQRDFQLILAARGLGTLVEETYDAGDPRNPHTETVAWFESGLDEHWDWMRVEEPPTFNLMSHAGLDLSDSDHQAWLREHVRVDGVRYLFLDPLYMLVGGLKIGDGGDELRPVLRWLTEIKNELGCAVVLTHHMTDKGGGNEPASLLGTTFIHGWYESSLLVRRSDSTFHVKADGQRELGVSDEHALLGLGTGVWLYTEGAQGQTDAIGRAAPAVATKELRIERLRGLYETHGPGTAVPWTYEQFADELGVDKRTIKRYMAALRDEEPS